MFFVPCRAAPHRQRFPVTIRFRPVEADPQQARLVSRHRMRFGGVVGSKIPIVIRALTRLEIRPVTPPETLVETLDVDQVLTRPRIQTSFQTRGRVIPTIY